ncbi:heat shock factor-binding protein 1-like protein 1 isoform X1 [Nomascus leucogenys]|uniref:heat shock factor-binding protein 1-like protein 1 isoform X1 n=1 Tax=Nomascus leucogenys TaxID=61853 RepID=UPI00122DB874|nr:heat shock factor-binding protein 1-like protein 1 isoform X1 [Nomascus leucogenys]
MGQIVPAAWDLELHLCTGPPGPRLSGQNLACLDLTPQASHLRGSLKGAAPASLLRPRLRPGTQRAPPEASQRPTQESRSLTAATSRRVRAAHETPPDAPGPRSTWTRGALKPPAGARCGTRQKIYYRNFRNIFKL